jgi:hypothetical protein
MKNGKRGNGHVGILVDHAALDVVRLDDSTRGITLLEPLRSYVDVPSLR